MAVGGLVLTVPQPRHSLCGVCPCQAPPRGPWSGHPTPALQKAHLPPRTFPGEPAQDVPKRRGGPFPARLVAPFPKGGNARFKTVSTPTVVLTLPPQQLQVTYVWRVAHAEVTWNRHNRSCHHVIYSQVKQEDGVNDKRRIKILVLILDLELMTLGRPRGFPGRSGA